VQEGWLRAMLRRIVSPKMIMLECVILVIPLLSDKARDEEFTFAMQELLGAAVQWSYRCGIMITSLNQDRVAAARWICIATRAKHLQPWKAPRLRQAHLETNATVEECLDLSLDVSENGMCSLTQEDRDRMHDIEGFYKFLPAVLAIATPPESYELDQDIAVLHPDYPCSEPNLFLNSHKDQWPAVVYEDDLGVNRIRALSVQEVLTAYQIPSRVQDAYRCSNDLRENVNIRLAACVPWRTAEVLTEPILEFLLISRHDPDENGPMPRSVSALVSSGMPTQEDWTEAYEQD
jgi:hypothetical protein